MTKKQLFKKLKSRGVPRKTGEWQDYELGKSLIQTGKFRQEKEYEQLILWLTEYCNV